LSPFSVALPHRSVLKRSSGVANDNFIYLCHFSRIATKKPKLKALAGYELWFGDDRPRDHIFLRH